MTLPASSESVRTGRYVTRMVLSAWRLSRLEESAVLVVSELLTNAVRHARGTGAIELDLHATQAWLRIEIQDHDRQWPRPRVVNELSESGFGFVLIDALAATWGVRETETGKAVWAELDVQPGSEPCQAAIACPAG